MRTAYELDQLLMKQEYRIEAIEKQLYDLQKIFEEHIKRGDNCPHTGE